MSYKNKRPIPTLDTLAKRANIIKNIRQITIVSSDISYLNPKGLEYGNKKTKSCGVFFNTIFVWNMPVILTCPGASAWCLERCYNADDRIDVYPINEWCENLWWYNENVKILKQRINEQISYAKPPVAVRLHSSGDFFSNDYLDFWLDIVKENKHVLFWGYTRSWNVNSLKNKVIELSMQDNVSLFASWDNTMTDMPQNMKKSIVLEDLKELRNYSNKNTYTICPEQFSRVGGCADCARCIYNNKQDVIFIIH